MIADIWLSLLCNMDIWISKEADNPVEAEKYPTKVGNLSVNQENNFLLAESSKASEGT